MRYQSLKGFRDILPPETEAWEWLESTVRGTMARFGFSEIRLPIVEATELFVRSVGEDTDVVGKEMYTFEDRSDPPESITLRPELTAGAARAYVEHSMAQREPVSKWFYHGPAFRYEQPQAGRFRQFSTVGVEVIGSDRPEAEVEVIGLAAQILDRLGISETTLLLNSIGTPQERADYRNDLVSYLSDHRESLSEDSRRRLETNPLRVLDSKEPEDIEATREAPTIAGSLQGESREHFDRTCELLQAAEISFQIEPRLVRGLDYYTRTVFEFTSPHLGSQSTMIGGGRYDNLIEQIGGKPAPAIGFGAGLDRLLLAAEAAGTAPEHYPDCDVYFVALDDASRTWTVGQARRTRESGLRVEYDLLGRSMKAQMREANRKGARYAVIVGGNELESRTAQLKDMKENTQESIPFDMLYGRLTERNSADV